MANRGYTLVVGTPGGGNLAPYSKHKTLATARKTGNRIAHSFQPSTPIEIWTREEVDAALNRGGKFSGRRKEVLSRKTRKKAKSKSRSRRHRRNSSKPMPTWFWPALVGSGLVSIWLWKKANPGQSLNPTV